MNLHIVLSVFDKNVLVHRQCDRLCLVRIYFGSRNSDTSK